MTLRTSSLFIALMAATSAHTVCAADKATCAAAAEEGQRLVRERKLVAAREQLLVCSSTECPDVVSRDCTQWLGEVERGVASVVFKPVDPRGQPLEGVRVTEGGVVVAERATSAPVDADPGHHVFRFEHAGFDAVEQPVDLQEGKRKQEIVVTLAPRLAAGLAPPRERARGTGVLVTAIAATGLAVAAGGLYAGFGLSALSDEDALRKTCAPYCTASQTASTQTKLTVANVALVSGIVAAATAGVLWIVWAATHAAPKHVGLSGATFVF